MIACSWHGSMQACGPSCQCSANSHGDPCADPSLPCRCWQVRLEESSKSVAELSRQMIRLQARAMLLFCQHFAEQELKPLLAPCMISQIVGNG